MQKNILDTTNNFLFQKEEIKPKYIIFCNGDKKKTIYQSTPKEIKISLDKNSDNDTREITYQVYIQNAINIDDDIENYTHAIIIDENDKEHVIKKIFY